MFFYIYDDTVLQSNQSAAITKIENRLIELGINGRTEKLSPLRNLKEVIELAVKHEAHTVIVVGSDETFLRTVNLVAPTDIALGYIPFASDSSIAKLLGITDSFEACNVMSRRITKMVDLVKVNQHYAFYGAEFIANNNVRISCNNTFSLEFPRGEVEIFINNIGLHNPSDVPVGEEKWAAQKKSAALEIIEPAPAKKWLFGSSKAGTAESRYTLLPFKQLDIKQSDEPISVVLDSIITIKTPLKVEFKPKQIKLIVGKQRLLN